jgi:hypothetical protein
MQTPDPSPTCMLVNSSELLTTDPPPQSYGETRALVTEIPEKEKTPPMPPGGMDY